MKIIRHYACLANDELYDFFSRNKISFHQDEIAGKHRVYFDVLESDAFFPESMNIALSDCIVTKKVKYSQKEITNAQWLTCTPVTAKVNLANQEKLFWYLKNMMLEKRITAHCQACRFMFQSLLRITPISIFCIL